MPIAAVKVISQCARRRHRRLFQFHSFSACELLLSPLLRSDTFVAFDSECRQSSITTPFYCKKIRHRLLRPRCWWWGVLRTVTTAPVLAARAVSLSWLSQESRACLYWFLQDRHDDPSEETDTQSLHIRVTAGFGGCSSCGVQIIFTAPPGPDRVMSFGTFRKVKRGLERRSVLPHTKTIAACRTVTHTPLESMDSAQGLSTYIHTDVRGPRHGLLAAPLLRRLGH
ncbi:hypothetical protein EDD16DRAFT_111224 [Pisolithus croceorrhizus]|nr:hypothetical protein F5141DRAFT_159473 [Pisolithus sp. B1]KAI6107368.1 hypothetical protein EDD16DRAFT_111224 [Pisolithus croceorrhizus]